MDKLIRLSLLARCLIHFLFYGKAIRVTKIPAKIVVVLTGKLGDIVCGTPVLSAIRKHLPETKIFLAGDTKLQKELLAHTHLVDEYIDLEASDSIKVIRGNEIEVALVTGPSFGPAATLYLAHVPLVVIPAVEGGYSPAETRPYKILKKILRTFPYRMGEYAPRERLRALEAVGIVESDTTKHLSYSEEAENKINKLLDEAGIKFQDDLVVGITPSAGNKIKEWPPERFAEIADYLIEKHGARIILIGSASDEILTNAVLDNSRHRQEIVNLSGRLSIDELKALISKLKLFISVDTGPIYIAEAFGIPTIDIVGPMDEKEQPPQGPYHVSVVAKGRLRPELHILNSRMYDAVEARRQVEEISVEMVKEEVDKLISKIKA